MKHSRRFQTKTMSNIGRSFLGKWLLLAMFVTMSSHTGMFTSASGTFSKALFQAVLRTPGNRFYSPASVKALLAIANAGAKGKTAAQLQQVAELKNSGNFKEFSSLLGGSEGNMTLDVANGVFVRKKFPINSEYEALLFTEHKAELRQVDFSQSKESAQNINSWVSGKTNHKISQLFEDGALDAATKLVLVNAVYFKGEWQEQFLAGKTRKRNFYQNDKEAKEVDFMTISSEFRAVDQHDVQIVELPYVGGNASMILVVPKKIGSLEAIEKQFSDVELPLKLLNQVLKREVVLKMPKFKLAQTLQLKAILMLLGITDLFSQDQADLSGISSQPLYVSDAVQKVFIEVNEEGSEAAAASSLSVAFRMEPEPPLKITADAPFLFFIQAHGHNLFAGRLAEPWSE